MGATRQDVDDALERHVTWLMGQKGVQSVGVGDCDSGPCLSISTSRIDRETRRAIEDRVKVPVTFSESGGGDVRAYDA